jgi:hypothetical protein
MSLLFGEYPTTEIFPTVNSTIPTSLLSLPCKARLNWTLSLTNQLLHFTELTELHSELELLYDWQFTANQFVLATSSSRPTTGIFIFHRFETPPTWRVRSPYLHTPGTMWPGYTQSHWVPLSSLPTTHRATVGIFDPPPHGISSLHSTGLGSLLHSLGADQTENTASKGSSIVVMNGCLVIIRISFPRERVYRAVTEKCMFLVAIVA